MVPKKPVAVRHILAALRTGRLTSATVVAEVRKRQAERPKIGKLALDAGMLTMRQVCTILDAQGVNRAPFGQTAVALGYMTQDDVDCILAIQATETTLSFDNEALNVSADSSPQVLPHPAEERTSSTMRRAQAVELPDDGDSDAVAGRRR